MVLPSSLGGPSGHVAEKFGGEGDVGGARDGQRFAVIERLEVGELFDVRVDQVAELPDELAALGGRHLAPLAFECFACGFYR